MITVTDKRYTQRFGELEVCETFLAKGCHGRDILYLKLDEGNLSAVCLEEGVIVEFGYDEEVVAVDVEVNIIKQFHSIFGQLHLDKCRFI